MDQDIVQSIVEAVEKLQESQKVLSNKIIKLTEVCRNKFSKIENKVSEKNSAYEARFKAMNEDIEGLKSDEVKLSDDVLNLESERTKVDNQIQLIDDALEEIKLQIDTFKKDDSEQNKANENKESRKPCKYDKKGFWREADNYLFFHADAICEIYMQTGLCWKLNY